MNDSDKKNSKVKTEKVAKTTKPKAKVTSQIEVEAETKVVTAKKAKAAVKAEIEPKVKVTAKTKAKTEIIKVEPKVTKKSVKAEAKIEEVVESKAAPKAKKVEIVAKSKEAAVEAKAQPKAKTTKAVTKAKEIGEVKAELRAKKSRAKKVAAESLTEAVELNSLPLAAKIQTQENFDLTQTGAVEEVEMSPVFKELAEPTLPALREDNRAFLQIQSPTRVFFYWSLKQDSYNTLRRALGNRANDYFLAIRLTNLKTNRDEIHRVESKGSWWFNNIEADAKYRAEVGFYAPQRPFVRIVFSNTLETPRQKPSSNTAYQPYFAVTANQFAEVLDLAGFSQDAFDVYVAGDEPQLADEATQKAFAQLVGTGQIDFSNIDLNELRYVLFALASGVSLVALRENVSANLFEFLAALIDEKPTVLTEEKVILALEEFFGFSPFEEDFVEEFGAPTVFGASLINFPAQLRKKTSNFNPKLNPLSSFSLK